MKDYINKVVKMDDNMYIIVHNCEVKGESVFFSGGAISLGGNYVGICKTITFPLTIKELDYLVIEDIKDISKILKNIINNYLKDYE